MADVGTTALIQNYNMSLTFVQIGGYIGAQGPEGSPTSITAGPYTP